MEDRRLLVTVLGVSGRNFDPAWTAVAERIGIDS